MKELLDGFSVERLEEIIGRTEFWGHGAGYTPCEVIALARIALAVKQAKPVFIDKAGHEAITDLLAGRMSGAGRYVSIIRSSGEPIEKRYPIYTVPQPAVSDIALQNFRAAMEGIGHIRRTLEETFGGLHGTHVDPDVLVECKAICDAICEAYRRNAPPAPVADAIDSNLVEALRLVQCMLEDYRERNYGNAEGWIRHINTHMSDYSEAHGDDAYSVLHDLLPAVPQQESDA